jgi:glycosyltransferase involved in cell wall biosynthesis
MDRNPSPLRIGVVDQTVTGWVAAAIYSRMLLRSLEATHDCSSLELYSLTAESDDHLPDESCTKPLQLTSVDYFPTERQFRRLVGLAEKSGALRGELRLRHFLHLTSRSDVFSIARANKIAVLLPLLDLPPWRIVPKTIGWIPDFQHLHLPEFFRQSELQQRDTTIKRLAKQATLVMLSSEAAHKDFATLVPAYAHKARVIPFPSLLAFETLADDPVATQNKFNLPEKFALVANQFWAHKNHALVVKAIEVLHRNGLDIPVVMTGLPADHRDPANKNLSRLLQVIAAAGLNRQITILGLVPYPELVNLMRTTALVIQPSRFEGWSTVVQDAVALGRPLLCSDITVHREQLPAGTFFPTDSPEVLAKLIASEWESLTPGPNQDLEKRSLEAERHFSARHGKALLGLCQEAAAH